MYCCNSCGNDTVEMEIADGFFGNGLRHCLSCNHIQVAREPQEKELAEHYQGDYSRQRSMILSPLYSSVMSRRASAQVAFAKRFLDLSGRSVVDYGCGYGWLLKELSSSASTCFGLDYDPEAVNYCRTNGLEAFPISSSEDALEMVPAGAVIFMSHVLEHVRDINSFFERIIAISRGLFIEVPRYDFLYSHAFEDQESHLNFFSPSSMEALLKRHDLTDASCLACGPPMWLFWRQNRYVRCIRRLLRCFTRDPFWGCYSRYAPDGMWLRVFITRRDC